MIATTVKAGLITGQETLELLEFNRETPGPKQVAIEIRLCGICSAEVRSFRTGNGHGPSLCGHEWVGVVQKTGPDVESLEVGDRVVLSVPPPCRNCESCQAGRPAFCLVVMTVARGRDEGAPEYGGFADWVCLDEQRVLRVDEDIEDVEAAFVEPAAIAGHAVTRSQLTPGDSVTILGAGVLGLLSMQWVKASGSSKVTVVEPRENRRALALELGADLAVTPGTELPPADVVIECAGQGESVEEAVGFARQGGRVVLVGDAASTIIAPRMWLAKEVEVVAAAGYVREDFRRAVQAIADGQIRVKPIYSRTIKLQNLATTLRDLAADTTDDMKIMVDPR